MALAALAGFVGRNSFLAHAATVNGDATCGYNGTTQFNESTVVRWAQVNGVGSTATFIAYANDENSTLLGVSDGTKAPTAFSPVSGQTYGFAAPGNGGSTTQHDQFGRPYYPALYITNTTTHSLSTPASGNTLGTGVGDWQQGGTPRNLSNGTPFVDDVFGTWVTGTQTTNPSNGQVGTLTSALNTTVNTTVLQTTALSAAVASGDTIVVSTTGHTQNFKAAAPAAAGATSISVTAVKANFAYPVGSTVTDSALVVAGNYARQATLPAQNHWNLGPSSDTPVGNTFANMGDEGFGTEFRWNANELTDSDGNPLAAGNVYKIQIIEHDGDQNKGGDSGEYCALVSFPGIKNTTAATNIVVGNPINDTATVGGVVPNQTVYVQFHLFAPGDTTCSGSDLYTGGRKSVTADSTGSGSVTSDNVTANQVGDYHWTADLYDAATGGNLLDHSGCNATGETSHVFGMGSIKVTKTSIKGPPLAGAKFSITGPGGFSATLTSGADGTACVDQLTFGSYTVQETSAPAGYTINDTSQHQVSVNTNASCTDTTQSVSLSFSDTPLTDLTAEARSETPGGTASTITCVDSSGKTVGTGGGKATDSKLSAPGLQPGTYTCTIGVDP